MRRTELRRSAGTQWPHAESDAIHARDGGCIGPRAGLPGECYGQSERHHVRASHGIGMKSESTRYNGVLLCNGSHHPWATVHGREARPLLLSYLSRFYGPYPAIRGRG
jgi:hypothetical protein